MQFWQRRWGVEHRYYQQRWRLHFIDVYRYLSPQIAYCNNIIERNKRITLPVAGLSSSASGITSSSAGPTSEGKPLLLGKC